MCIRDRSIIPPSCCNVIKESIKKKEPEDSGFDFKFPGLPGIGTLLKMLVPVAGIVGWNMLDNMPQVMKKFDELKSFLKDFSPKSLIPEGMIQFYNEQIKRINADWQIFQDDVQKIESPKVQTQVPTEVMETVPDEVKKPLVQVDQPAPVEIPPAPVQQPASEPILKDCLLYTSDAADE